MGGENDNGRYFDEDRDNSDYKGSHSQSQVNFTENGNSDSPSDLEFDEIEGRHADSDVDAYLANHTAASECSGVERDWDCDVFKTCAETELAWKSNGANDRATHRFGKSLSKIKTRLRVSGRDDFARTTVEISRRRDRLELRKRQAYSRWVITRNEGLAFRQKEGPHVWSSWILLTLG